MGRRLLGAAILTAVAVSFIGTGLAAAVPLQTPAVYTTKAWVKSESLPSEITWVAYSPVGGEAGPHNARRAAVASELVVPVPEACPPGTTNYGGTLARFDCITIFRENGNQGEDPTIGLRRGDPTREPGFGRDKILNKHGINQRTIGYTIVNNRVGITQPNGNELYGLEARVDDMPIGVNVEVIVQQAPSNEPTAPDQLNLGVVTAYCKGFDGLCPAGVNESIAPGQP